MSSQRTVVVARRFRGPELSGNGGYTAGLLAGFVEAASGVRPSPVTVTLRRPPPLDVELAVVPSRAVPGSVDLVADGGDSGPLVVASAGPGELDEDAPAAEGFADAAGTRPSYRGAKDHPFPGCFVCGTDREPGDGLRLAPGQVAPGRTACVWLPDPSLATGPQPGLVGPEFVWAALDCPGGWTSDLDSRPLVLGRMTAEVDEAPLVGRPYVVVGERLGDDGRKTFSATALYDGDRLLARAEQVWLAVDPAFFNAAGRAATSDV